MEGEGGVRWWLEGNRAVMNGNKEVSRSVRDARDTGDDGGDDGGDCESTPRLGVDVTPPSLVLASFNSCFRVSCRWLAIREDIAGIMGIQSVGGMKWLSIDDGDEDGDG